MSSGVFFFFFFFYLFCLHLFFLFFFFNDTATTEIYTLSLHDALPISHEMGAALVVSDKPVFREPDQNARFVLSRVPKEDEPRSEEHTSELQSRLHLVCRLLLEKKKKHKILQSTDTLQAVPITRTHGRR